MNVKAFELCAPREGLVERHERERVRPIARGHEGRGDLERVSRRDGVKTDETLRAAADAVEVRDPRPALELRRRVEPQDRGQIQLAVPPGSPRLLPSAEVATNR